MHSQAYNSKSVQANERLFVHISVCAKNMAEGIESRQYSRCTMVMVQMAS